MRQRSPSVKMMAKGSNAVRNTMRATKKNRPTNVASKSGMKGTNGWGGIRANSTAYIASVDPATALRWPRMLAPNALRRVVSPSVVLTRTRPSILAVDPTRLWSCRTVALVRLPGSNVVRCNRRMGRVRYARRWSDRCLLYELFRLLAPDEIIYIYVNTLQNIRGMAKRNRHASSADEPSPKQELCNATQILHNQALDPR